MSSLVQSKNAINRFYSKYAAYINPFLKFILALLVFFIIDVKMGYMDTKMNNLQEDWARKLHMEGELKKLVFADAGESEILRRDIAEKYVTELCGKGAAWLTNKASTSEFSIGDDGDIRFTFRLWEEEGKEPICCTLSLFTILSYTSCGLFDVIYDMVFGGVPSASNEIEIAKEPQLPR